MTTSESLRSEIVTADNVADACRIAVHSNQDQFVAPVAWSLAEAYVSPTAWPRLIYRGDRPVGFVMAGFDADNPLPFFRCGVWRLNVDGQSQRGGVGGFAVDLVLGEGRRRGFAEASVLWKAGPGGPADFYQKLGFHATGELFAGEVIATIALT